MSDIDIETPPQLYKIKYEFDPETIGYITISDKINDLLEIPVSPLSKKVYINNTSSINFVFQTAYRYDTKIIILFVNINECCKFQIEDDTFDELMDELQQQFERCKRCLTCNQIKSPVYEGLCKSCLVSSCIYSKFEEDEICAICQDKLCIMACTRTECHHIFHQKCLDKIKKEFDFDEEISIRRCPLCREEID